MSDVPSTSLEKLRAEFATKAEEPRLFKKLPKANLVAEYRPVHKDEVRKAAETADDEFLLVSALVGLHVNDPDGGGLVPLGKYVDQPGEDPIGFDHRLCSILNIEAQGPKVVALELFGGNDLQLAAQAGELAEWSLDTSEEKLGDFPETG